MQEESPCWRTPAAGGNRGNANRGNGVANNGPNRGSSGSVSGNNANENNGNSNGNTNANVNKNVNSNVKVNRTVIGAEASGLQWQSALRRRPSTGQSLRTGSPTTRITSLVQVEWGGSNQVVVYGPQNSVICASPNNMVGAGNYQLDTTALPLTPL